MFSFYCSVTFLLALAAAGRGAEASLTLEVTCVDRGLVLTW